MRIIDKRRDYYDSVAAYGVDTQIVYVRDTKFIQPTGERYWTNSISGWRGLASYHYLVGREIIGFCGKIYISVFVQKDLYKDSESFYTEESLLKYYDSEQIEVLNGSRYNQNLRTKSGIKRAFEFYQFGEPGNFEELFREHKTPAFVWGRNPEDNYSRGLLLNPLLRHYQFYKIKDPVTAFQDIQSYISGVLGSEAPKMIEVSNEVKAASRGHDGPYSFKKPPGGGQWR